MSRLLTLVIVLAATAAVAKPRIAVMPFSGPKAAKVKVQVQKKLCVQFTCVTPKKGTHLQVDAVVTGEVNKHSVELKVYTDPDSEPVSRFLTLGPGAKLGKKDLVEAPAAVKEALKSAATEEDDGSDTDGAVAAAP
jgi:hypothetical protein